MVKLVEESNITTFKQQIGYSLKPTGPRLEGKEMEKGKEKESEQYALWMKTQTDPDTYEKLCKEWFIQIMHIPKNVEVSFNTDPSGLQTSIIVSTKDRVYLVKYSADYDLEIYNSIRGSLLGISAKMYNVGFFSIPMECFMYLSKVR